jgi:RNA polymerase sigma factor (sigma-70 family)
LLDHYEAGRTTSFVEFVQRNINDQAALNALFARIRDWAFGVCRAQGLNSNDADDAAQNTVIRVGNALERFRRGESTFRNWLFTIAANEARRLIEQRGRPGRGSGDSDIHELILAIPDVHWVGADDAFAEWARREAIARLRGWNHDAFRVFIATVDQNMEFQAVADEMGIPLAKVYRLKHRAVTFLRAEVRQLTEHGPGPGDSKGEPL